MSLSLQFNSCIDVCLYNYYIKEQLTSFLSNFWILFWIKDRLTRMWFCSTFLLYFSCVHFWYPLAFFVGPFLWSLVILLLAGCGCSILVCYLWCVMSWVSVCFCLLCFSRVGPAISESKRRFLFPRLHRIMGSWHLASCFPLSLSTHPQFPPQASPAGDELAIHPRIATSRTPLPTTKARTCCAAATGRDSCAPPPAGTPARRRPRPRP
jgi:hypothetical protein